MSRFFRDFFRLIGRYRRGLFITVTVLFGVYCVLLFTSYRLSTNSEFCDNCHYEESFVQSWKESAHSDVECHTCHLPPTFGAKVDRSMKAIDAAWRYAWGLHTKIPRAEIDDRTCLQEGCHDARLIEGPVEFVKGILFDHAGHMGKDIRGMTLHCTSCHSQIVQGSHMEVTRETCFLCHFKNLPEGEAIAGCSCHDAPADTVVHEGFRFKHTQYLGLGVVCEECHVSVTSGEGNVPKRTCMTCHNARLDAYDDKAFLHRKHVAEHDVNCSDCHEAIEHGDMKLVRSLETTCTSCHTGSHDTQRDLFMGIGARGVEPYPSIMFKAQVGCDGCHRGSQSGRPGGGKVATVAGESCVLCHGRGFDKMLDDWKETVDDYMARIAPLEREGRAAWKRASSARKEKARERYEQAEYNLDFLRRGHGEHNLVYTKLILLQVQDDLNAMLDTLSPGRKKEEMLAFREDDLRGNCTKSCHANLRKTTIVEFAGMKMTHNDHVYKHNMECTYCHDNSLTHGAVKLTRENCLGCHHSQENVECITCHAQQERMLAGTGGFGIEETPSLMEDVACEDCHTDLHGGNNRKATLAACADCHEEGYEEMVADWQSETEPVVDEIRSSLDDLRPLIVSARSRGIPADSIRAAQKQINIARARLEQVVNDKSRGAHNVEFAGLLLDAARTDLSTARRLVGKGAAGR